MTEPPVGIYLQTNANLQSMVYKGIPGNPIPPSVKFTSLEYLLQKENSKEPTFNRALLLVVVNYRNATKNNEKNRVQQRFVKDDKLVKKNFDKTISVMCLHSTPGNNAALILVKTSVNADKLFGSNTAARDGKDGFGPGALIVVRRPKPISEQFGDSTGFVPILEFSQGMLLVDVAKSNISIPTVPFKDTSEKLSAFTYRNVKIKILNFDFEYSYCRGYLCDSIELKMNNNNVHTGCPCFTTVRENGRTLLCLEVEFISSDNNEEPLHISIGNFMSRSFTDMVTKNGVPKGISQEEISAFGADYQIFDQIMKLVEFANKNGGWSIVGWYRRGRIKDQAIDQSKGESITVRSGDIIYHVTNVKFNGDSKLLDSHKADVSSIVNLANRKQPVNNDSNSRGNGEDILTGSGNSNDNADGKSNDNDEEDI